MTVNQITHLIAVKTTFVSLCEICSLLFKLMVSQPMLLDSTAVIKVRQEKNKTHHRLLSVDFVGFDAKLSNGSIVALKGALYNFLMINLEE